MKTTLSLWLMIVVTIFGNNNDVIETVGEPVLLIDEQQPYISPVWSPDGKYLAMTTWQYQGISVYSFDTGAIINLTQDPGSGYGFEWSPDGQFIATRISKFENKRRLNALAILNTQTGEKTLLSNYMTYLPGTPKWSQRGENVFITGGDSFQVFPVPGGNQDEVLSNKQRMIYLKRGKIFSRQITSGQETKIPSLAGKIIELAVSPDRTRMAYNIMGGPLVISDIEGNETVNIGRGSHPVWNPSGNRLSFTITEDDGHQITGADIFVINADGFGRVNITNTDDQIEMHPDWSPDGRWIVFDTFEDGEIWMQEVK